MNRWICMTKELRSILRIADLCVKTGVQSRMRDGSKQLCDNDLVCAPELRITASI